MGGTGRRSRLLLSAACCLAGLALGSCHDPSLADKSIWAVVNSWEPVGSPAISPATVMNTSIAVAPDGTPCVAFMDGAIAAYASVMKFNGAGWTYLGSPGFSDVTAGSETLAFDSSGVPYVAFTAGTPPGVSVMNYTAAGWNYVGGANISGSTGVGVLQVSIAIDPAGVPYVAYADSSTTKTAVLKYSGTAWTPTNSTSAILIFGVSTISNVAVPVPTFSSRLKTYLTDVPG